MSSVRKFVVAVLGTVVIAGVELLTDSGLAEWGPVVIALATALGVYRVPNAPTE